MPDILLKNVRPLGGPASDVAVSGGRIVIAHEEPASPPPTIVEGGGAILLPGLIDSHMHLDKSMIGLPWYRNETGPRLADRIEAGRAAKRRLGMDVERQTRRQALRCLALGTTAIRTHVDVDDVVKLRSAEAVLAAREALRGLVDIEVVAFPQSGMLVRPGVPELMEEALKLGVDIVGGIDPSAIERDPRGHIDFVFGLAERHGVPLDIHLHEPAELGAFAMELIIDRTRTLGMQGKVTISHAFCLGMLAAPQLEPLLADLAEARISVVTTGIPSYPTAPLKRMVEAGIAVCAGSDGTRDTFGPYGDGDMLERAKFISMRNTFYRDADLELALDICTNGGARVLGLADYGLQPGSKADFVLVEAETVAEAVVSHPRRRTVFKGGRMVARDGELLVGPGA